MDLHETIQSMGILFNSLTIILMLVTRRDR